MVNKFVLDKHKNILEPGCGIGNFIKQLPVEKNVVGVELDEDYIDTLYQMVEARTNNQYTMEDYSAVGKNIKVIFGDFLECTIENNFDIVIGNPPFGYADKERGRALDCSFMSRGLDLLEEGGDLVFLLETKFFHGVDRFKQIWKRDDLYLEEVNFLVRRPRFSEMKGTGTRDCSIFHVIKGKKPNNHKVKVEWLYFDKNGNLV